MSYSTLSWIQSGVEYVLEAPPNFYLRNYEGFGLPEFHRLSSRGPLQHGDTDEGFRLDPRIIQLVIGVRGKDEEEFHQKRVLLDQIFKPMDSPGILRWTLGTVIREIQCYTVQRMDGRAENCYQEIGVSLKANDPRWYDPQAKIHYFTVGGGGDLGEVPTPIPMLIGASTLDQTLGINYKGTTFTSPVIRIRGSARDIVITHLEKGWKLDFTGFSLGVNDEITIDLRYGRKTVLDQDQNSKLDKLSFDSDLANFMILSKPELASNTIRVSAQSIDPSSRIEIEYQTRYIAV